jgi:Tol biopolymer transport system component
MLITVGTVGYLQWDKAHQLAAKQVELDHAQANLLGELSEAKRLAGELDTALRLAASGTRIDLALPPDAVKASLAGAALAAAVSQVNWRRVLDGHDDAVTSAAFSPDGTRILTADWTARIWDAATANEIAILRQQEQISSAAFSPDGRYVVTASRFKISRVWDAATGNAIGALQGHRGENGGAVHSAVFSPDSTRIVTASSDETARVWDAATFTEIAMLGGHLSNVFSAAFSPDGTRIVTASHDKTARIWDAATAKEIAILRGHEAAVGSAAFSPDGKYIVTSSLDKSVRIWDARFATTSMRDLVVEVCMRRLRGLTKLNRDQMRLAGYSDTTPEIDVCAGVE